MLEQEFLYREGYQSPLGLKLHYADDTILGQYEIAILYLEGKGDNDYRHNFEPNGVNKTNQKTLLENRYRSIPDKRFISQLVEMNGELLYEILDKHLTTNNPRVLEIGAGSCNLSKMALYPFVNAKQGSLICTELVSQENGAYSAWQDTEIPTNLTLLTGVNYSQLSNLGIKDLNAIVSIGAIDVSPSGEGNDTAREIYNNLADDGIFIHFLDLGAGSGHLRNISGDLKRGYAQELIKEKINLDIKKNEEADKNNYPFLVKNNTDIQVVYDTVQELFLSISNYNRTVFDVDGVNSLYDFSQISLLDIIGRNDKSETYKALKKLASRIAKNPKSQQQLKIEDIFSLLLAVGHDGFANDNEDIINFVTASYASINNILSLYYIQNTFESNGFKLVDKGFVKSEVKRVDTKHKGQYYSVGYMGGLRNMRANNFLQYSKLQTGSNYIALQKT